LHFTAFIVFYKKSILHLIFFMRYVPHNKKSRKKNFVFNLKKNALEKESCIKIKTRKNKPRLRKELNILIKHV